MTITLHLPPELESELQAEAARLGLPFEEYLVRILSTARPGGESAQNGADLVAYWQNEGLIGMRSDIENSQRHARELRKQAEKRERK